MNDRLVKIILHRIISVVCLTSFLSETWNLSNPWWWDAWLVQSVKRWQDPTMGTVALMIARESLVNPEGQVIVWVVLSNDATCIFNGELFNYLKRAMKMITKKVDYYLDTLPPSLKWMDYPYQPYQLQSSLSSVVEVLDVPYSQLTPLSGVAVQARQLYTGTSFYNAAWRASSMVSPLSWLSWVWLV
jgi:hypothetical protein